MFYHEILRITFYVGDTDLLVAVKHGYGTVRADGSSAHIRQVVRAAFLASLGSNEIGLPFLKRYGKLTPFGFPAVGIESGGDNHVRVVFCSNDGKLSGIDIFRIGLYDIFLA